MTDTPKDLHLAIWELLTPGEKPHGLSRRTNTWGCKYWGHLDGALSHDSIAHRAILDAAREVLDLAGIEIHPPSNIPPVSSGWYWDCDWNTGDISAMDDVFDTRTECIYHALKWLREEKK
jgi:hypothetical protein